MPASLSPVLISSLYFSKAFSARPSASKREAFCFTFASTRFLSTRSAKLQIWMIPLSLALEDPHLSNRFAYFCVCVWSILSNLIPCPSSQDITGLHFTHFMFLAELKSAYKQILTRRFSSRLMVAQSSAVGKAEKVVCPLNNGSLNILNLQDQKLTERKTTQCPS